MLLGCTYMYFVVQSPGTVVTGSIFVTLSLLLFFAEPLSSQARNLSHAVVHSVVPQKQSVTVLCTLPAYFWLAGARVCVFLRNGLSLFSRRSGWKDQIRPVGIQPWACLRTCVVVHGPLFFRCVCQFFFLHFSFLSLELILTFPCDMIPLLVLILSHFYVIKPDEASGPNTHNENRELFLIPGMPMVNNAAQLLEWTASYINGFQSFWRDALF